MAEKQPSHAGCLDSIHHCICSGWGRQFLASGTCVRAVLAQPIKRISRHHSSSSPSSRITGVASVACHVVCFPLRRNDRDCSATKPTHKTQHSTEQLRAVELQLGNALQDVVPRPARRMSQQFMHALHCLTCDRASSRALVPPRRDSTF